MKRPTWLGRFFLKQAGVSFSDERFWSTWSPQGMVPSTAVSSEMRKAVGDGTGLDVIMSPVLWIARRMAESPIGVCKVGEEEIAQVSESIRNQWMGMGPKVKACIRFLEWGGERAIITSLDKAVEALEGKTGTRIGK